MYEVHDWAEAHRLHHVEGLSKAAVAAKGGRAHLRRGDRVQPVLQPGGNGHLSTGHRSHALVATSFELPDLALHVVAAPTRDMAPVAASVVG